VDRRVAGLLRLLAEATEEHPDSPEGIELYRWVPVLRSYREVVIATPCAIVFPPGCDLDALPDTTLDMPAVTVVPKLYIHIGGERRYWVGWNDYQRIAAAWVLGGGP
jgi:hypothetical protein